MNAKEELIKIIREELKAMMSDGSKNWWQTPSDVSDPHLAPNHVHEAGEKKKGERIGKSNKTGKYTSAGTVPNEQGRKLSDSKIKNRKAIGDKMLNALRRGGPSAKKFREKLNTQLEKRGKPTDRLHQYSMIWANASSIAAGGGTAADWNVASGSKSKKKESKPAPKSEEQ